ncbi:apolipoprotein N-acyltransferase [Pelagibacteraceae bacterium]|nr:apolipoprotein N-acyltransferase [Pelagibacteraceae bacterium]
MINKYLNNRFLILYVTPFILGSLTVFSFQPFNFTIVNFLILPLLFYFIFFINKKSKSKYRNKPYKKNLLIFGTIFGYSFYLSGLYWISYSLTFDENFKFLIPIALIFIPLFLSLFFSIIFLIFGPYLKLNLSSVLVFSGALAFSDFIRAKILTGFPWNLWAYSFSWAVEIIQPLNLIGLFAFNLIIITLFTLPAVLFFKLNIGKKITTLILIILIFFIFYIYGNFSINQNNKLLKSHREKFNIKVISPNFNLQYGLSIKAVEERLKKLVKYSKPNNEVKTLFVWPEGSLSGYSFSEIIELKNIISNNFNKNHFIIFGINKLNKVEGKYFNSLLLVNNKLKIIQQYNKQKLVPFGEFLPLEKLLNNFGLKKITEGQGSFLKGNLQGNIKMDNLNILPMICYEIIFTKLIQQSNEKTNLVINISEDGWFGDTIGPHQHFAKAIFRAIEQDTFLIRSANKGISAIISNKGEIIKKLNIYEKGSVEMEVPLIKSNYKNKNDLIFFILLFTYFLIYKNFKNEKQ